MQDSLSFLHDHNHEQLVYRHDKASGLRALIAVHDTTLGPSLGGTRLWHYDSVEAATIDVLRLSEGMTYKAAVAGLPLGGGKSVIMADGKEDNPQIRMARFKAFGKFVQSLGGKYIAAEDVGTKPDDMINIRKHTMHVAGLPEQQGGSGDPSPMTAFGVLRGIEALVEDVLKRDDLDGVRVAIQGLGKVGLSLAQQLIDAGVIVVGSDVNPKSIATARAMGVTIVEPDAIYDVPCDIFAPCALGAVINDDTIKRLDCKIIAGSANNQLDSARHGEQLHRMGIIYAVDYVINAGGLINVATELEGYNAAKARARTDEIYYTIKRLLERARMDKLPTTQAAQRMAQDALNAVPV